MAGQPSTTRRSAAAESPAFRSFLAELDARVQAAAGTDAQIAKGRNLLTRHAIDGRLVMVKSFGSGRWWRRGGHKAVASFDHAAECARRSIGSPEPLAAQPAAPGSPWRDHFCCALIPDSLTAWRVLDREGPDPHAAIRALAGFIAAMHQAGVDHRDLTPGNVLITPTGEHLLVDTNRMQFFPQPVPLSPALTALAKLAPDGLLLDPYLHARQLDTPQARRVFTRVTRAERTTRWLKDATRGWRRRVGV